MHTSGWDCTSFICYECQKIKNQNCIQIWNIIQSNEKNAENQREQPEVQIEQNDQCEQPEEQIEQNDQCEQPEEQIEQNSLEELDGDMEIKIDNEVSHQEHMTNESLKTVWKKHKNIDRQCSNSKQYDCNRDDDYYGDSDSDDENANNKLKRAIAPNSFCGVFIPQCGDSK